MLLNSPRQGRYTTVAIATFITNGTGTLSLRQTIPGKTAGGPDERMARMGVGKNKGPTVKEEVPGGLQNVRGHSFMYPRAGRRGGSGDLAHDEACVCAILYRRQMRKEGEEGGWCGGCSGGRTCDFICSWTFIHLLLHMVMNGVWTRWERGRDIEIRCGEHGEGT